MNRSVLFVVILLITSVFAGMFAFTEKVSAAGPTNIEGVINTNTTWSAANSPYIIQKNTTVMPGTTLTITAGTVIKFDNNTRLNIRGFLDVKGNSTNRVLFTNNGTRYNYSHTSLIDGNKVVYNGTGVNYSIYIDVYNGGEQSISYAKFEYSSNYAITFRYAGPYEPKKYLITDTIFENNAYSINPGFLQSTTLLIKRCTFNNNFNGLVSYYRGGAMIQDSSFNNNTVASNVAGWVLNCSFNGNGIGVTPVSSYYSPATVKFSRFENNLIGLETSYSIKNTFENNAIGLIPFLLSPDKIINNNFINNTKFHLKMPDVDENEVYSYNRDAVVSGNWWGTTNTTIIDKYIYDVWDEASLFEAKYKPILNSTANAFNEKPVAEAGPDRIGITDQGLYFYSSDSYDPDDDELYYYWDFGDGSILTWTTSTTGWHVYTAPGVYNVTLKVTDGIIESTDTLKVTIKNDNTKPIANAGPDQNVEVNQVVYFDGGASYDPDGDPLQFMWYFGDGANTSFDTKSTASHVYTATGTYNVDLKVYDGIVLVYDRIQVVVSEKPNTAPVAYGGIDKNVLTNQVVIFNASGSFDADGDNLTYNWDFDDSDGDHQIDASGILVNFSYTVAGNYTVTLRVSDGKDTIKDTVIVKVTKSAINRAPVADAGQDRAVVINELFIVDGKDSTDPDNDLLQFRWDFGNGSTTNWSYGSQASHSYSTDGSFSVTLYVTDGKLNDTDNITITVTKSNKAPIADAGPDWNVTVDQEITFSANDSYDPDNDILSYKWDFGDGGSTPWDSNSTALHSYNKSGTYKVTLTVDDSKATDTDTCYVYVIQTLFSPPNNFPKFLSLPDTLATTGIEWVYEPIATDPDIDDIVLLSLLVGPEGMAFVEGALTWTPTDDQVATHLVVIDATDGLLKVFQTFNVTVIDADVDLTPPVVESTEPVLNSDNISIDGSNVIINFSEPMDRNSVEEALTITPDTEYEIYWNDDDTALFIIFTGPLSYSTTYTISIGSDAKDKNGNVIDEPLGLVFTTESFSPVPDDNDDGASNDSENAGSKTGLYILILSIIIIVIITVFYLVVLKGKRMRRNEPEIGPGDYDERMIAGDERTTSGPGPEDEGETEAIGLIVELRDTALTKKKPSDFRINKNEILNKTRLKYDKGEISKETYESIEENLVRPES